MKKFSGLLAIGTLFVFCSCSTFSQSARQQAAYQRYVRKCSANRVRQQKLFASAKPQMPVTMPEEQPQAATSPNDQAATTESGPVAATTGQQ